MNYYDNIHPKILKFWESNKILGSKIVKYETSSCIGDTYISYTETNNKIIVKILAKTINEKVVYHWDGDLTLEYSEADFLKLLKMKAFI